MLDGIPRNEFQAKSLQTLYGNSILGVLALTAEVELLVERFQKRRFCNACNSIVSLNNKDSSDTICPRCGAEDHLVRRKDDEPNIVRERFKVYENQTASLFEFYSSRKILYKFDALDTVEKVYVFLANCILQKIDGKC